MTRFFLILLLATAGLLLGAGPSAFADEPDLPPLPDPLADVAKPTEAGPEAAATEAIAAPDDAPEAAPDATPEDAADGDDVEAEAAEAEGEAEPASPEQPFLDWLDAKTGRWTPKDTPSGRPPIRRKWSGSLRVQYRHRSTNDDTDNDLFEYVNLSYGADCARGWSFSLHGRLSQDLDGDVNNDGFYVFDSVTDTFGSWFAGMVYHAWANYRPCGGCVEEVRIGRQYVFAGDYFQMDGVRANTRPLGCRDLVATAFVGIPSHLYETSPEGDFIGGFTLEGDIAKRATAKFSYAHIQDDNDYYGQVTNNLYSLEVRGNVGRRGFGRIEYQHLDDEPRYLTANYTTSIGSSWFVRAYYRALLTAQNEQVYDLDSYFAIAQSLEPYWDGHLAVSKDFGTCWNAEVGATVRELFDSGDEGTFNRDFGRYYGAVSSYDVLLRGLDVTVSGERWDSHDDVWAVALDLDYRPSDCWRFQIGTDYSAYRFDIYSDSERIDNYGYYVRATYRPNDRWRYALWARLDDDDLDEYLTVRLTAFLEF